DGIRSAFEREYAALFRRAIPGAAVEALSWSVLISTRVVRPQPIALPREHSIPEADGVRTVFDGLSGRSKAVPLYRRRGLQRGARVAGPALIAEDETATFVSAGFDALIDAAGSIVMDRKAG